MSIPVVEDDLFQRLKSYDERLQMLERSVPLGNEIFGMLRGRIDTSGSGTITNGKGFTIVRNSAGDVTITYNEAFTFRCAVVATVEDAGFFVAEVRSSLPDSCRIVCFAPATSTPTDTIFHFFAIGPRQ